MLMLLCRPFKSTVCHQGEDNYTSEFLEATISSINMLKRRLSIMSDSTISSEEQCNLFLAIFLYALTRAKHKHSSCKEVCERASCFFVSLITAVYYNREGGI